MRLLDSAEQPLKFDLERKSRNRARSFSEPYLTLPSNYSSLWFATMTGQLYRKDEFFRPLQPNEFQINDMDDLLSSMASKELSCQNPFIHNNQPSHGGDDLDSKICVSAPESMYSASTSSSSSYSSPTFSTTSYSSPPSVLSTNFQDPNDSDISCVDEFFCDMEPAPLRGIECFEFSDPNTTTSCGFMLCPDPGEDSGSNFYSGTDTFSRHKALSEQFKDVFGNVQMLCPPTQSSEYPITECSTGTCRAHPGINQLEQAQNFVVPGSLHTKPIEIKTQGQKDGSMRVKVDKLKPEHVEKRNMGVSANQVGTTRNDDIPNDESRHYSGSGPSHQAPGSPVAAHSSQSPPRSSRNGDSSTDHDSSHHSGSPSSAHSNVETETSQQTEETEETDDVEEEYEEGSDYDSYIDDDEADDDHNHEQSSDISDFLQENMLTEDLELGPEVVRLVLEPLKRSILKYLMEEFWVMFDSEWTTTPVQAAGTPGSRAGDCPTQATQTNTSQETPTNTGNGKKRSFDENNENSEDPNSPDRKRMMNATGQASVVPPQPKYACPFRQRFPRKYNSLHYNSCAKTPRESITRVREHCRRTHLVHRCPRCKTICKTEAELKRHIEQKDPCIALWRCERCNDKFTNVVELNQHLRGPKCQLAPAEGYTSEIDQFLKKATKEYEKFAGKPRKDQTPVERWVTMFKKLFPEVEDNAIPSPYFEEPRHDEMGSPTSGVTEAEQFRRERLPRMVKETMSKKLDEAFDISKQVTSRLMRELVDVIKGCMETLDREWNEKTSKAVISNSTSSPLSHVGITNQDIMQVNRSPQALQSTLPTHSNTGFGHENPAGNIRQTLASRKHSQPISRFTTLQQATTSYMLPVSNFDISHMDATYSERMSAFMSDTMNEFPMGITVDHDPNMAMNQSTITQQDGRELDGILNEFGDPAWWNSNFVNGRANQGPE